MDISLAAAILISCLVLTLVWSAPALPEVSVNSNSMIFYNDSGRHYGCKSCPKILKSASEAINAGYRAWKKCAG